MKIYYKKTTFFLTDQVEFRKNQKTIIFKSASSLKKTLLGNHNTEVAIYHYNLEVLKKAVFKIFKPIYAAGGIVTNSSNKTLMIFRNGLWDIPKGKAEKNESLEETALREVSEETGLKNLEITSFLDTTYHIYKQKKRKHLKMTFWYNMHTDETTKLTPQKKEGIEIAEWVNQDDLNKNLKNAYLSIKGLIKKENF